MNDLKQVLIKFFTNLNCEVVDEEDSIKVSNIPQKFGKFAGNYGPYFLSFKGEKEGYELITQSHYLIKAINEFLEGRGSTTILELETNFNPEKDLPKIIPFRNSEIKSVHSNLEVNFIFKFTFSTTYQYLSEKETLVNHIYIRNGEIIDFESDSLVEGNKRRFQGINLENEMNIAKSKLKELTTPKTQELGEKLKGLLEKEIERIKKHYKKDLEEFVTKEIGLKEQISKETSPEKKKKVEKMLENLQEGSSIERIRKEEQNFIQHEVRKHSISINNKLMNIAVIHFLIYKMNLTMDLGDNKLKIIEMVYDPVKEKLNPVFCKSCEKELNEIIICASGHFTCRDCGDRCESCKGVLCKACNVSKCVECDKSLCSDCVDVCSGCRKSFCKTHLIKIPGSNKNICRSCVKRCAKCGVALGSEFTKNSNGKLICTKCGNADAMKDINEIFGS